MRNHARDLTFTADPLTTMDESAIPPLLGVIGHPIAGNPTQFAMEQALDAAGLDWRFLSFDVTGDRIADAIRGIDALGFRGVSIAPPHNAAVFPLVEERSATVESARWVDALSRTARGALMGHNLIGDAFVELLDASVLRGATVAVLGDCEKCVALSAVLMPHGVAAMWLRDADPDRLAMRVARTTATTSESETAAPLPGAASISPGQGAVRPGGEDESSDAAGDTTREAGQGVEFAPPRNGPAIRRMRMSDASDLSNVTVMIRGRSGDGGAAAEFPERQIDLLPPECVVVDLAVCAGTSPMLRFSAARGLRAISVIDLLVVRAASAFRLWTGQSADAVRLREAFEEYLEI